LELLVHSSALAAAMPGWLPAFVTQAKPGWIAPTERAEIFRPGARVAAVLVDFDKQQLATMKHNGGFVTIFAAEG